MTTILKRTICWYLYDIILLNRMSVGENENCNIYTRKVLRSAMRSRHLGEHNIEINFLLGFHVR